MKSLSVVLSGTVALLGATLALGAPALRPGSARPDPNPPMSDAVRHRPGLASGSSAPGRRGGTPGVYRFRKVLELAGEARAIRRPRERRQPLRPPRERPPGGSGARPRRQVPLALRELRPGAVPVPRPEPPLRRRVELRHRCPGGAGEPSHGLRRAGRWAERGGRRHRRHLAVRARAGSPAVAGGSPRAALAAVLRGGPGRASRRRAVRLGLGSPARDRARPSGRWAAAVPYGAPSPRSITEGPGYALSPEGRLLVPDELPPMEYRDVPAGRGRPLERRHHPRGLPRVSRGHRPRRLAQASILLDRRALVAGYPELAFSGGRGARVRLTYQEALVGDGFRKGNRDEIEGKRIVGPRGRGAPRRRSGARLPPALVAHLALPPGRRRDCRRAAHPRRRCARTRPATPSRRRRASTPGTRPWPGSGRWAGAPRVSAPTRRTWTARTTSSSSTSATPASRP